MKELLQQEFTLYRHPQHFAGILAQVGFSFLLSGFCSSLVTTVVIAIIYINSWKEEKELIKELGEEYEDHKNRISMLAPEVYFHKRSC